MDRRSGPWLLRILFALTLAVGALSPLAAQAAAPPADATPTPTSPATTPTTTTTRADEIVVDEANPFIPEGRDLTECIGTLPRPGCGSEARGGWHQNAVAIVMITGLLVVFGRIAWGVRRNQKSALASTPD